MIPVLNLSNPAERQRVETLLAHSASIRSNSRRAGRNVDGVQQMLADVAQRGDAALVDIARRFDDPTSPPIRSA